MPMRIALLGASGLLLLLAGCADRGRPIASTRTSTVGGSTTLVTVRGDSVSPADALGQIGQQAKVTFAAADDREPLATVSHGAEPKALQLTNQPFWQALLDVITPAGWVVAEGVTTHGGTEECPTSSTRRVGRSPEATRPRTFFLGPPSGEQNLPPPRLCVSNGFLLSARYGGHWTGDGVEYVSLELSARPDPNVPAVWWELARIDELSGADGKTPEGEFSPGLVSLWKDGVTDVPLTRDDDAISIDFVATAGDTIRGGRIARLRGKGRAAVAVESETLEVSGLARDPGRLQRRVWRVGGLRVEIAGLTTEKYGQDLTVRAVREGQSDRQWERQVAAFVASPPALYDANGRGFDASGTASYGDEAHGHDFFEITYSVIDRDSEEMPWNRSPPPPRAVDRLVWEIPTKVRYVETPFDFTDVVMTPPQERPAPDASARR